MPRETIDDRQQLAAAIADAIERSGEGVPFIAEQIGVPQNSLWAIASGNVKSWTVDNLIEVCAKIGINVSMAVAGVPATRTNPKAQGRKSTPDGSIVFPMREELIAAIASKIAAFDGTQNDLVEATGVIIPTVSRLRNQHTDYFRLDKLIEFARKFGLDVTLTTAPA
ncbi:XRE family transcriptional regulator [Nocardia sp. FBN12]|uniref:XRE family transcriptional regulator n=1 Tax=Nocardia sp. FBN12 TaxID=3419766 RepID=UPI003CFC509E